MANNLSIAQNEMRRICTRLRAEANLAAEPTLRGMAGEIARMVYSMMSGFYNVTGNTINSVGVALYYNKQLRYIATSAEQIDRPATRKTLRRGERYNKKYYWDGAPARVGKVGPFVGKVGDKSFYAVNMIQQMARQPITLPTDWSYKIVVAVPYAQYLEQERGANVITTAHDLLASAGGIITDIKGG